MPPPSDPDTMLHLALALAALALDDVTPKVAAPAPAVPASLELGPDNADAWAAFIRPDEDERRFEQVGWRNAFWPAVQEARALGRPLLLWTMNGHPLGCT